MSHKRCCTYLHPPLCPKVAPTSVWRGDGARVVHPSEQSQHGSVCRSELVLPLVAVAAPARPDGGAAVGGLSLLGRSQVVEVAAVGAGADGAVQAHGALARLLGLALARPHMQTWEESRR